MRWVRFKNVIFQLNSIVNFTVSRDWDDKHWEIHGYIAVGYPASRYAGVDARQEYITFGAFETQDEALMVIEDIVGGRYDMRDPTNYESESHL